TFSFAEQTGSATINNVNHTISVEVSAGTDLTDLVATFTISTNSTIAIVTIPQVSGVTSNDFTNPVTYTVTAENGTPQDWVVTVTVATTQSSENDILSFSFAEQTGQATIDATNHTVDIEVAYGTNVTTLVATFTISDLATIIIGAASQESGVTSNDFTSPVTYTVTAEDGTQQDWVVTVTVATTQSSENDILTFIFAEQTGSATINNVNHTISVKVSAGTDLTDLVATFTISTNSTIAIVTIPQVSGVTSNDFTNPVTYTVTAENGTPQDWVVTVTEEITLISTFPYLEDFEDGEGGWHVQGTNSSWQLGTPAGSTINSAGSGSKSWVTNLTGNHNTNETSFVYSPTYVFTNLTDAAIAMKIWWDSEGMYDGTCFQYSINDGTTWQSVGNYNDLENWYNSSNIEALYSGIGTSAGWSGDGTHGQGSDGWITARHKLSDLDGNSSVNFRFAFASNDSYEQDGFAFDSIKIYSDASVNIPVNTQENNLIQVFPNPNKGIFFINARFEKETRIRLELVNPQGQIVFNLEPKTGKQFREELNVSHLPAGIYYLKMTHEETVVVKKIVIE
ncbi:MAG: T9SS type A sorting domain-containing protein, partial [Bacteroidales bacterium]|nr:T9SS type A sorting domain-containing protein [Bacteroidales bacterium]